MCIAIPGPFGSNGPKTPLGRFIRSHPASLGIGAATVSVLVAVVALLLDVDDGHYWSIPLLLQGIGALLLVGLLARVPTHCGAGDTGYMGHWLLSFGLSAGMVLVVAGGSTAHLWLVGTGLSVSLLTLVAGARNLRWHLSWCHQRPGAILRLAPAAVVFGAVISVIAGFAAWCAAGTMAMAAVLLALGTWFALALGLHETGRPPVLG